MELTWSTREDIMGGMHFYEVWVASQKYHGMKLLTYSHSELLSLGAVVSVPLGSQKVIGFIAKHVAKPAFETKQIHSIIHAEPIPEELRALHAWIIEYYPAPSGLITQLFVPSSLGTKARSEQTAKATHKVPGALPTLTDEQNAVIDSVRNGSGSFLLHGDTGTGKTRVYLELARETIDQSQSVIVLTPEIGLTPQLISQFEAQFPGQVIGIHSTQTGAERRNSWLRIHNTIEPLVIIGPRSALFSPLKNVGLIVLDEAHDGAYKQEQAPHYQTTRVAARLADLHDARLLLGTATPLVQDYYTFAAKDLPILRMSQTPGKQADTTTEVVDLRAREHFTRSPWLSNSLLERVEAAINNNKQSLVFLNRRGTARLVLCKNCGWQALCPRCDLPLTYHGDQHQLRCHTCGYTTAPPVSCPVCQSADIQFKSVGTKTIVDELTRLFPRAKIQRFDGDNKKAESLEEHYSSVRSGDVDILVGTQMLSKGLDLPKLTVVGVVVADTSLYFPDYTAEERTFQMLRQVIGRVGRGHNKGHIVVQSYYPDSPTIRAAVEKDYASFYESQLKERQLYRFPPYFFLLKITVNRASQQGARKAAQDITTNLLAAGLAIELSGPAPSFNEKAAGRHHWQIIVKAKQRGELLKTIALLPKQCSYDIDPTNLL